MTLNKTVLESLQVVDTTEEIKSYLVNYATDEIILEFLLPPRSLTISGDAVYQENNPLYGKKPYVRFQHARAQKLTVNFIFTTPCERYSLASIESAIDALRYPVLTTSEIPVVNEDELNNDDQDEVENELPPTPDIPGIGEGLRPGEEPEDPSNLNPNDLIPNDRIPEPTINAPETSNPNAPPVDQNGNPVDPNEPVLGDDGQPTLPGADTSRIITTVTDPPQLSLIFGERVIAPIKLESYTFTEGEDHHNNGLPTYIEVTLNFIGLSNPII